MGRTKDERQTRRGPGRPKKSEDERRPCPRTVYLTRELDAVLVALAEEAEDDPGPFASKVLARWLRGKRRGRGRGR